MSVVVGCRLLLVLSAAQILKAIEVRSRLVQIPENYDKTTAPPLVDGKPNIIKITADIFSIPDFDEKDEVNKFPVRGMAQELLEEGCGYPQCRLLFAAENNGQNRSLYM